MQQGRVANLAVHSGVLASIAKLGIAEEMVDDRLPAEIPNDFQPDEPPHIASFRQLSYAPDPAFVAGPEGFMVKPAVSERRQDPRIPCRHVRAELRSSNQNFLVTVLNMSRGGFAFETFRDLPLGATFSVATHYIAGGQNIYQEGCVHRVERRPTAARAGEYAIKYAYKPVR